MRIHYTHGDWYGIHAVITNQRAIYYFKLVEEWLFEHPAEIVVLWISRHGDENAVGQEQYPDVDVETKIQFWSELEALFGGMLINHEATPLTSTTVEELVSLGTRVAILCSDWQEFTGSSPLALDPAVTTDNHLPGRFGDPVLDTLNLLSTWSRGHPLYAFCSLGV